MAEDSARLSLIQKLCIETAKSGSIAAFIELFRYTHMEQPLGRNQPSSTEDLIAAAGAQSPEVVDEFCFDNPLQFQPEQLRRFQDLLEDVDRAGVARDHVARFDLLSQVSDMFAANQTLRAKAKLHPLVTPYPVVTSVSADSDTLRSSDVLDLISSPQFRRDIDIADPLLAAVAKMRQLPVDTHVYPPLVVHYAILARNAFQDFLGGQEREHALRGMLRDVLGAGGAGGPGSAAPAGLAGPTAPGCLSLRALPPGPASVRGAGDGTVLCDLAEVPENLRVRLLLYAVTCYLRLGRALHQFQLYLPAHLALEICVRAFDALEAQLHADFDRDFQPTIENGLAVFLPDEGGAGATPGVQGAQGAQGAQSAQSGQNAQGALGASGEPGGAPSPAATPAASAQLDGESVPALPASILDTGALPTFFPAAPERPDGGDAGVQGFYASYTEGVAEYAYAARSLVVHNVLCLASGVLGNSIAVPALGALERELRACDWWIREVAGAKGPGAGEAEGPAGPESPAVPADRPAQAGSAGAAAQPDPAADLSERDLAGPAAGDPEAADDPLERPPPGLALPPNANYRMVVTALALYKTAADTAFKHYLFALILPCARRLFELATRLGVTSALRSYTDRLLELGGMFAVTAHLWLARWAALEGNAKRNIHHLSERWKLASEEMGTTVRRFHELMAEGDEGEGAEGALGASGADGTDGAGAGLEPADGPADGPAGSPPGSPSGLPGTGNSTLTATAPLTRSRAAGLTLDSLASTSGPASPASPAAGTPKAFQHRGAVTPKPSGLRTQRLAGTDEAALTNSVVGFGARATPRARGLTIETPATPSEQEAAQLATTTRAMLTAREAVSAASALSFAYKAAHNDGESIRLISDAWKTAEDVLNDDSQIEAAVRRAGARRAPGASAAATPSALGAAVDRERQEISGVMVEARVRYGAIQGQVAAEQAMRAVAAQGTQEAQEGEEELEEFLPGPAGPAGSAGPAAGGPGARGGF